MTLTETRPTTTAIRRPLRVLVDVLLGIAAGLGLLFAVLAVLTSFFGFRVMLFSSGSMEPTIPVGSAALVRPVDAADIEVGDVVTIDRGAGELPVTHRVVSIEAGAAPEHRSLTLRGDANAQDDPAPYEVAEAGRVILSVPGIAPVVSQLGTARGMAPLGVVAAALVVWGLWPRSRGRSR